MDATLTQPDLGHAIGRATQHAPFLRHLISMHPEVVLGLRQDRLDCLFDQAEERDWAAVARDLRIARQQVALAVALADLSGIWGFERIVAELSRFADYALHIAIRAAIAERYPGHDATGFTALALGKHGSRELNYSSDIDPILLFDPTVLPRREREDPAEAAVRIARRVVELLQSRDENGYVLRVDLRLRPSPEATALALPVEAAIGYYESSALPWERAAFIRARAAAGDVALGECFLKTIRPFVWRRSLDFGAIAEIRGISRRIRTHHSKGQAFGPGYDLKRGRGGIREIEFFAQIHQLIYGGREPDLRAPATLDALSALSVAGRIDSKDAADLAEAYVLFRTIEHRLQMVDDQQTHRLPPDQAALENVAKLSGCADAAALLEILRPHVERVGAIYDALDPHETVHISNTASNMDDSLAEAGFSDPVAARALIDGWRSGKARALRSPAALDAFENILPTLLKTLGQGPDPNIALLRFDAMVERLPSALNLFRLLEARPGLLARLGGVLAYAPALADALSRHAELLDGLIDATALAAPPSIETLVSDFGTGEAGETYEDLLDRVRRKVGERRFALGVQLIEGEHDPIKIAQGYSRVAEAALSVLTDATIMEYEKVHGRVPGGELVILALGRLGGGSLTYASDLDLIYLFTGGYATESDGRKPLSATTYFNRLAQRVSAALSAPTAAGPLYEIDTRLRPSGTQGLLAVSFDSFEAYQRSGAWTWEHMALTRARPVFGSAAARTEIAALVEATLRRPRDADALRADARKMRADIATHKPPASPFDVKLVEGGLVDCEFAVHVLQLEHGIGLDPRLRVAASALAAADLLDLKMVSAHALLTRVLVTQRLVSPFSTEPPDPSKALVARVCGLPDWQTLLAAIEEARQVIGSEWRRVSAA